MPAIAGCIIFRPKWNGAPGQKLLVIRRNHENRPSLSRPAAQEGPRTKTTKAGASRSMTVANLPMFRDAFRRALHSFGRWTLSVEGDQRPKGQATIRHPENDGLFDSLSRSSWLLRLPRANVRTYPHSMNPEAECKAALELYSPRRPKFANLRLFRRP